MRQTGHRTSYCAADSAHVVWIQWPQIGICIVVAGSESGARHTGQSFASLSPIISSHNQRRYLLTHPVRRPRLPPPHPPRDGLSPGASGKVTQQAVNDDGGDGGGQVEPLRPLGANLDALRKKRSRPFFFSAEPMFGTASPFRGSKRKVKEIGSPAQRLAVEPDSQLAAPFTFADPTMFDALVFDSAEPGMAPKRCACRLSKCIKMYCDCFAAGQYCGRQCECTGCGNHAGQEAYLAGVRRRIKQRNPHAFAEKVSENAIGHRRHSQGCRCTKSKCLKRYCECFREGMQCTSACRCSDCGNGQQSSSELPQMELPGDDAALLLDMASELVS